ncbi:helicase associated domain-containing protein [Nocardia brasiliensis]
MWSWDPLGDQWEEGFTRLTAFVRAHQHAQVPKSYVDETGFALGSWVGTQRTRRGKDTLSVEQQRRLSELPGWIWDTRVDQWEQGFRQLADYVDRHGDARVPSGHVDDTGYRLGQWCKVQRRNRELSTERRRRLDSLPGWTWNAVADQWEDGFAALADFVEQHGHARVPRDFLVGDFRLWQWVLTQRSRYAKGRMPDKQMKRLEDLTGWSWDTLADQWEEGLAHLVDYVTEHGQALVPQDYVRQGGFRLGTWVATQRSRYAKGTLDPARVRRIEQSVPDWSWDPYTDRWELGFAHLFTYVEKHGHARVPRAYEVDGYRLGGWCKTQRTAHAKGSLSTERYERLNSLTGWTWDANAESWEEGLAARM